MAKKLLTTPKGRAVYPWLNKADDKFGAPKYKVDLVVDAGEASELTAKLEDLLEDFYQDVIEREGAGKYDEIYKDELPFFEEDGNVTFRSTVNKNGKNKKGDTWENKVSFYDASAKFIDEDKRPRVGGGSLIRVSFEPNLWTMPDTEGRGKAKKTTLKVGISMRLKGVQIFEVQQGGGAQSAAEMGFGAEEGGYQYDPNEFDADTANDELPEDGGY